ncbi:MAG: hypothetical protein ACREOF_02220 [Gemmatimonadales bacterium]
MRLDSYGRYALLGALLVSLACARNTGDGDDTNATGRVTTADTGAPVRMQADTNAGDTAGTEVAGDTVTPNVTDSAPTGLEPTVDTATTGPGWPVDTMHGGGWSTPADSGR